MEMKNHYLVMFIIMILSGLLSTMNVWVDKISDIRYSINDVYMTLLMTGWMFLFMGIYYRETNIFIFGLFLVIVMIFCIRTQLFVSQQQYEFGMIPHHSMAILMSKKLLEKKNNIQSFLHNLINVQEKEIQFLKNN
jgi:hypothetical protein